MVDYTFDAVDLPDPALGVQLHPLLNYLSRQGDGLALYFEPQCVEHSVRRKNGKSLVDCPLEAIESPSGPWMLLCRGAKRDEYRRVSDPRYSLQQIVFHFFTSVLALDLAIAIPNRPRRIRK